MTEFYEISVVEYAVLIDGKVIFPGWPLVELAKLARKHNGTVMRRLIPPWEPITKVEDEYRGYVRVKE